MATLFTREETLVQILAKSNGPESAFGSWDSEEELIDSNCVYGFPNGRDGNAFAIVREVMVENDEADFVDQISVKNLKLLRPKMVPKSHLWMRATLTYLWQGIM